jgi:GNAT superfamily N-acetyltransferase
MSRLTFLLATPEDAPELALLNQQLIQDEASQNPMTLPELELRMSGFLRSIYTAVLFHDDGATVAYALYRDEELSGVFLRQFYVVRDRRRQGIGREAFQLFRQRVLAPGTRITLDVLVKNQRARAFWEALGFRDYAVTYELR